MLNDGSIHERACMLPTARLFTHLEGVINLSNFFVFVSDIKVLTGDSVDFVLRIKFFYVFQSLFMVLVITFDAIKFHYSHVY